MSTPTSPMLVDGTSLPSLATDELQRYNRHLILPNIGEEGQRRLKAGRVLLVGAGGLGSSAALYLAAAGVGHLGIVDHDAVELSNLQRQILHDSHDVGRPKVASAADRLRACNPHVEVATFHTRLTSANALQILGGHDIVVDGSDNFATRYLVNDACVLLGIPNVHGSVIRFDGQASVFGTAEGPCYRCLFPLPPAPGSVPGCAEGGVLGVLPGLIGVIQATETIKLLTGCGESLAGRLLMVDALRMRFRTIEVPRNESCPACGTREITTLAEHDESCGSAPAPVADDRCEEVHPTEDEGEITPRRLEARLLRGERITVIDVREPYEWSIAHLPGARLIPLGSLPNAVGTVDRDAELVVYCHHGQRSDAAAAWLRDHGFASVYNLVGGIDRWSLEVDASLRRY